MVGPARNVKGGMTTVVDNYYEYGLNEKVVLKYIETINDKNKISKFIKEIKGILEYKKNIDDFDIIHIHMASRRSTYRKIKYIKIAKKHNKKIVLHVHGGGFKKFYDEECTTSQRKHIRRWLKEVDRIIVLSDVWKEYFNKILNYEKIEVIYNGVKANNIKYNFDKKDKLLFVGRINKEKGIYDLLEAMKIIIERFPKIELNVCGTGDNLQKIIKKLNLTTNINLKGWLNKKEIDEEMKNSTIFILPSYYEAMPMSILEAMSHGNAVISTRVGSIPTIIKDKNNGILINPGNKDELLTSIYQLLENKKLKEKISKNALKTISNKFSIDINIEKLVEIYENI